MRESGARIFRAPPRPGPKGHAGGARAAHSFQRERVLHVLDGGEDRKEIVRLKDEAHRVAPQPGQAIGVERLQVLAEQDDTPARGHVEPRREIERRGLPRARGAREGRQLALLDGE